MVKTLFEVRLGQRVVETAQKCDIGVTGDSTANTIIFLVH